MANINIEDITNVNSTGTFDVLMDSINKHIELQYNENRITGSDYANVYLGSVQAALSQSIQFTLQEQLLEAQVDGVLADNLLKDQQLLVVGKQLLLTDEQIANAISDRLLKDKQLEIANVDKLSKQYELDNILPEQLIKLQEEIDLLQTQDSEVLLDGVKKRESVDAQILDTAAGTLLKNKQVEISTTENLAKQYKLSNILPEQLIKLQEEIDLLQTQDSETLLDGIKKRENVSEQTAVMYTDRVLKDKQAAKLGLDNVMKKSELDRQSDVDFIYKPKYKDGV